jgi:ABC-type uncharacterized transport system permease subunit
MGGDMQLMKEIRFFIFRIKKNFANEKVLRSSFLLQMVGVFISNLSFFIIWIVFSRAVGPVNGWGALQTFGMLSISIFSFGVVHSICGSMWNWYEMVPNGAFDSFLTKPKSLFLRVATNRFSVSACGDLIQGMIGIAIFIFLASPSLYKCLLLLVMIVPAIVVHFSLMMFFNYVIFWLPQATSLTRSLNELILLPSTQPISILKGGMRFFYLFIIPALLIGGLPIEVWLKPDWGMVLLAYAIAAFWFFVSHRFFYYSLRRYESGNCIGS